MKSILNKPIFIIGLHRTGSTFLKNILNNSLEVAMATDEMDISNPWKRTFENQFKKLKTNSENQLPFRVIDLIYKKNIYGTFWFDYRKLNIPPKIIYQKFCESNRTLQDLTSIMLEEYRELEQKKRVGVKYPLHFSRSYLLKDWFPDSKLIFLYRDARAICASKLNGCGSFTND